MMKLNRIGALGLSLALTLSLAVVPAHAAAFTDLVNANGTPHWAAEYIEDMHQRGYAAGEGEKFYPERTMSTTEALLFCARVTGVDEDVRAQIYADRGEEVAELLPERVVSWATPEMSVAVEAGIISLTELEALGQTDPATLTYSGGPQPYLLWNISRENVCMYLVRAIQLEPLAKSMSDEQCLAYLRSCYADADEIDPALRPYVYILTYYKIFSGLDNAEGVRIADPKGALKRCQMAVLMSQALDVMEDLGIRTELSEYTDYDWTAGRIASVTTELDGSIQMTLQSDVSGLQSCLLPVTVKIYEDNILADASFLRGGKYVRLNLNDEGEVTEARISGVLTSWEGTVSDLSDGKLTLLTDGSTRAFTIDRFTEVQAGPAVGDRSVIDYEAGYTDAVCYVDEMGHLAAVKLWGGTNLVTGLISGVTLAADGSATLTLAAPDGVKSTYGVPAAAAITVNDLSGVLSSTQVGRMATLRVTDSDNLVVSVEVDTLTAYLQGKITRQGSLGGDKTLTIADALDSNREVSTTLSSSAVITYNGESRTAAQVENGWFVTAKLVSGEIVDLTGFSATATVEGLLTSIQYDATTLLEVTNGDGSVSVYSLDVSDLPSITRGGKTSSISQLRTGDSLIITLRYNEVDQIEATPRQPDLTGTVDGLRTDANGSAVDVVLTSGERRTFTVDNGVSVTKNGATAAFKDLNLNDTVELVTSGDAILSINITAESSTSGKLSGTVYTVTNQGNTRSLTLRVADRSTPVEVDLRAQGASYYDSTGRSITLNSLKSGDSVTVYGSYNGAVFEATMVVKE